MKNICVECKYLEVIEYPDAEDDFYCKCGLEECCSPTDIGCNYSEEVLSLLQKYTEFENSELISNRTLNDYAYVIKLEEELKRKRDNGEEVDFFDQIEASLARERFEEVKKMDREYKRCNYLRFFKKNDPKGILRRHLKRKGQYPNWIHDLFYVENYDKYEREEDE